MKRMNWLDKLIVAAILILLAALLTPPKAKAADTLSAEGAKGSVWRIHKKGDCTLDSVAKMSNPALLPQWRPATIVYPDKTYKACWLHTQGLIYFIFEDWDWGMFEATDFKPETSI